MQVSSPVAMLLRSGEICLARLHGRSADAGTCADRPVHVLTLTPFYPSAQHDAYGCFVAEPLGRLSNFNIVSTVIAVQPIYHGSIKPSPRAPDARWVRYLPVPGNIGLASAGALLYARLAQHVRRLHGEWRIDLIHAHGALPCGRAAALLARCLEIPFVVSVHGLDAFSTQQVGGIWGRWCEQVSRRVYQAAHRVICVSDRVRREIVEVMGSSAEIRVVYNGVDPELFAPAPEAESVVTPTILSVGNLIPIKGHQVVLRAAGALADKYPMLRYEIIGDGPERSRLLELAQALKISDRVHFMGRKSRREVADAMKRCTVFALPSRYEGLGCVYLEAMVTAKPVIACRGQGIEEVIRHGENGWLVRPDNPDDVIEALSVLLAGAEWRKRLGREGRRTVLDGLTLSQQAERLNRVYRECIS